MPSSPNELDAELRRVGSLLEKIANDYSPSSPERAAIEEAAQALLFVRQRQTLLTAYHDLKMALGGELTPEMKAKLRQLGIDPAQLDEEA